ncbi:MAG: TauD/TfdA family dioxygenase [Alphaproteobacteria bacterium]|nr:DUF971 domain-containing protein [Rhodospirillaceae bacterium]MBT6202961.1 DUF971 domain-containing protein [Rhodospirillaceae bacterium]MBT6512419.1 DUF971 domain-containing protein [Rhodospirillaceae bacterium]MBT7613518.1 DUF971 domain-containing protein [Rhodospirillaceae bacterium]MDG2479577.1 TauD/TfdA family dioxygenase [Alphaproteobacteria bacterium]
MGIVATSPRFTINHVDNRSDHLDVAWADGHQSRFDAVWLRHTCRCDACGTYESGIRPLRLTEIPDDIALSEAGLNGDGGVDVVWSSDGHSGRFDADWLRSTCNSPAERRRRRWTPTLWGREIEGRVPEADYAVCKTDDDARLTMLEALRDYGFVLLRNVPDDPEVTAEIAALAGPLRVTNYGSVYDFTYQPDALVYGDLNVKLDPHCDEPYRQAPPSITCFHFVRAASTGGASTMTDGFRLGDEMREQDPEAFKLLSTVPLTHYRRLLKTGRDFRMRAPVFSLDEEREVAGIRLNDRGAGPIDADSELVRPMLRALRKLEAMLFDEANQVVVPVGSGEALFFNNQRVLHGRTEFAPDGERYMRTCNVELDEFYSTLRMLAQQQGREGAFMNLPHGALT